jgi:hypothetical protein
LIVKVGEQEYNVTETAIGMALLHIEKYVEDQYTKLPDALKLAVMTFARTALLYAEKMEPDKEKRLLMRPSKDGKTGKKADPTLHLVRMMMQFVMRGVPHVGDVIVGTDEENNVISIGVQSTGASGGSLSTDGNIRQRQDDGGQVVRPEPRTLVSVPSPLHP